MSNRQVGEVVTGKGKAATNLSDKKQGTTDISGRKTG